MPRKATVKTEETPKTEQSVDVQALMQQMQEMQKQIEALKKEKEEAENKNSDSENIIEMQNITKTDIKNIIAYGLAYCRRNHVQRYASLDDYFNKDFFAKNHYIEL